MKTTTMNISLPADLARFIRETVKSGEYASASEVILDGLRLLRRSANGDPRAPDEFDRSQVNDALEQLRRLSATQSLGSEFNLRGLIDEGRGLS
jgi:putative addiction module CopG family antidote